MMKSFRLIHSAYFISVIFVLISFNASGQNVLGEMDHDARHVYDRMMIMEGGGPPMLHSSIFPYLRADMVSLADSMAARSTSTVDQHYVQTIWDQNNEFLQLSPGGVSTTTIYTDSSRTFHYFQSDITYSRYRKSRHALLKTFYKTPAHFYEVDVNDFYLRVNPLIRLGLGRETNEEVTTFINQRGISLRGRVGNNVYFQTSLYDSQLRYPNYVNRFTDAYGVVPGAGLFKTYDSALFDFTQGRDYLLANAYVGVNLGKYIGFQLGHHQHFIGDGIRSLFLSDFSTPFFSLKINTSIWKFHYQNIFAELAADDFISALSTGMPIPKKYMAAHYLSYKPGNTVTLGLFETVVFNRPGHSFELQYLNPIILYRTVEGSIGSPDNVMLGINARVDLKKRMSLYGQFILDDISIGEILNGNLGWWGNKFGHQLGVKYINAMGISNLDAQVEWNKVRPYTYSHYDANANYSHYKQALAHPLGANFNEWILSMRYQVSPKLGIQSNLYLIRKGEDGADSISYGGDIIIPNLQRPGDFGNTVGQGIGTDVVFWSTVIQYEISSGLIADLQYLYRNKTSSSIEHRLKTNVVQLGIRLNMARREDVF